MDWYFLFNVDIKSFFKALSRKYFVSHNIFATTYLIEMFQILFCLWNFFGGKGGVQGKNEFWN